MVSLLFRSLLSLPSRISYGCGNSHRGKIETMFTYTNEKDPEQAEIVNAMIATMIDKDENNHLSAYYERIGTFEKFLAGPWGCPVADTAFLRSPVPPLSMYWTSAPVRL